MRPIDLPRLKKWFAAYSAGFYLNDPEYDRPLRLKVAHTRRVCENIVRLGRALDLSQEELILAEVSALFHDVGRFRQYRDYRTFNDSISENHAGAGVSLMEEHGLLALRPETERRLVTQAIAYHNAAVLPEDQDPETIFFMHLLRDADKLDILHIFAEYFNDRDGRPDKTIEVGLADDPAVSPRMIDALRARRFARFEDLKTLNDFKLLQISWVYDFNFTPSFQLLKDRRHIENINKTLPRTVEIEAAVKEALDYMLQSAGG
ncbi:MAG: HD domain-containing protein [Desulfobacterales bacterium]|nr:HD domain-containing protein [Desulfobacterales bacterium]